MNIQNKLKLRYCSSSQPQKGTRDSTVAHQSKKRRLSVDIGNGTERSSSSRISREASGSNNVPDPNKARESKKELDEFMEVMKPRTKERTWANDNLPGPNETSPKEDTHQEEVNDEGEESGPSQVQDAADDIDDLEWMKRRMTSVVEERDFVQDVDSESQAVRIIFSEEAPISIIFQKTKDGGPEGVEQPTDDSPAGSILRTGRLFLRNLSYSCEQADLEALFSTYGPLSQVSFMQNILPFGVGVRSMLRDDKHDRDIRFWRVSFTKLLITFFLDSILSDIYVLCPLILQVNLEEQTC